MVMQNQTMNRRGFLRNSTVAAAGMIAPGLLRAAQGAETDRPNIVVVLCDDLGYGDLECYGHPHIKTPHLDKLAKEGVRFTDFYSAAPVCSPARVGLLTGRSPNRAGVYDWIPGRHPMHMQAGEVTIPQLLKQAGYATCMSGKWHCNGIFNSPKQPQPGNAGFDHWFATQNNASPSHQNPRNFVRNGEPVGPMEGYSCQLVVDEALTWLKAKQAKDAKQPFFMYVAFHEPHEPIASPKKLVDRYSDAAKNENQAQYFANVANIDAAVGKLMAGLKSMNVDDNTLVIFTSDNGPETLNRYRSAHRSYGTPGELRGMKLWTTDAGFRVAGIMRWPNGIKAGQVVKHTVSSLDFLPTFCALANTKPPADLALDGTNFMPATRDQRPPRDKPLLWVYYRAINQRRVAMRYRQWKVLAKVDLPKFKMLNTNNAAQARAAKLTDFQMFDVTRDIAEKNDLSQAQPDKLAELQAIMQKHYAELVDDSHIWPARR
jgi:arylsulfatase A